MAFQPCPGIASCVIQTTIPDTDVAENVLHMDKGSSAAWTATELTNLVNAVDTWLTTGAGGNDTVVKNLQHECTVSGIVARDLTTSTGPEVSKSISHAGGEVTARTAAGLSKALTLRTGLAGRSQRGRLFVIGLAADQFDGTDKNLISTATLTSLVNTWTSLIAAVKAVNAAWSWSVLSRSTGNSKRANGVAIPITSVGYSQPYVDYQRRRSPFHQRHH